jgi:hypothetical protein
MMCNVTSSLNRVTRAGLALAVVSFPFFSFGGAIRLRNETLSPPTNATPKIAIASVNSTQSRLMILQFPAPPTADQRQELASQGIELLRYVPDHAYIARVSSGRAGAVASLAGASFAAPYLPAYKLDARLKAAALAANDRLPVCILLAPGLSGVEQLEIQKLLIGTRRTSPLRLTRTIRSAIKPADIPALLALTGVLWVEPDRSMKLNDEVSSKIVAGNGGVNQTTMQSLGYDGAGVAVAVADSGLNNGDADSMHPDLMGRTPTFFYYGQLEDAADEHGHGTHVAGIVAGNGATGEKDDNGALYGLGVAPGADIIAQRIFDGAGNYEAPASYEKLTRDATEAGAVVGSNSWGDDTQGRYDLSAAEFDELVRDADSTRAGDQPYILEFSAGNAGPGAQTMDSPAVGKNVLATGACNSDRTDMFIYDTGPETMADFSSRGPAEDGRIKPDLVAPGTWISSLQSESATDENAWSPIDSYYQYQGGTSQAGPHASGAAAVFVQYYRETHTNATPSPALVKAALINSATAMDPTVEVNPPPNGDEGWGRIDLPQLIGSDRSYEFIDQTVLLKQSATYEHRVVIRSADLPFRVTMAYTDVPGLPAALPALVNDLDLEVVSPDGLVYQGNQFQDGESVAGTESPDTINNVECVYISVPVPGEYTVRIKARSIVEDARTETPAVDQDFALVISGDVPSLGEGVVVLDRSAYTAPGKIKIRLFDSDLAGQSTATVLVRSTTEPSGETVVLKAATSSGSFTNILTTATGTAKTDGVLQIANGDTIEAIYYDASAATNRVAMAVGDLIPPAITQVFTTNSYGNVVITWTTDEAATSTLLYGTSSTSLQSVTDAALTTDHEIQLGGLAVGTTYFFAVVSLDEAGNAATNNNSGLFYSFVPVAAAPVMVVDAGAEMLYGFLGMPAITGYTEALDALGVQYDVWDTSESGVPDLSVLKNHRAVICRLHEMDTPVEGLIPVLTSYVNQGGSLFIASMDGLSRLSEAGATAFATNILHVAAESVDVGASEIVGNNHPIGGTLEATLDYSAYEEAWSEMIEFGLMDSADISDTITPASDAEAVFNDGSGYIVGLRWPKTGQTTTGRVVFFSFPFDAIPGGGSLSGSRAEVLNNVLKFLIPGMNGLGTVSLASPAYTLPARVVVEVDDSDLVGQATLTVTAVSPRDSQGVTVRLSSPGTNGVFTGAFTLVSGAAATGNDRLAALDGDTVQVNYVDASSGRTVSATAMIDTQPPVITGVSATADYQNVTISWTTSESADGLVQLGTSVLFDHSEYDAADSTEHEVTLYGLLPDTDYYFAVSSTDIAGNTGTDNNSGQYYKIRTLRPLSTPWTDALDNGVSAWTSYDGEGSETSWTLGVPSNGLVDAAQSAPNAWGSDLTGASISQADVYLISPAVYLTNGAVATLRFWHAYDFTPASDMDITEGGIVSIMTNSVNEPVALAAYSADATAGWEEVELDLTPYMGNTVYILWEYQLFSMDSATRYGWLVDDISITVTAPTTGSIVVSNNLSQAQWTLTGPSSASGAGPLTILTNLPAGTYVLTWSALSDYSAPAARTNTLSAGGTLMFTGAYTMPDENHNGISDLWEKRYFGSVSANHPAATDTDGDGQSDYVEFMAGTNPTNAASDFALDAVISSKNLTLKWTSGSNRSCRVLSSTNATDWSALSGWLFNTNQYAIKATNSVPSFYRIEIKP